MPYIKWEDSFSVGVHEIDEQHQKIIEIINRLSQMYEKKEVQDFVLEDIIKELSDYADYHFATEEKYFKKFAYEKTEGHIAMHNNYRDKIGELRVKYLADKKEDVFFELTNYLHDWWLWHINNADKEYTECFQNNGLN
ncbi:MAG: bacteriohemerythrin [Patescibacteria group bacterium]